MDKNMAGDHLTEFAVDILADDAHAAGRSGLLEELLQMETTLKQKMDKGVSSEQANKIERLKLAIDSSRMIVDNIWNAKYN